MSPTNSIRSNNKMPMGGTAAIALIKQLLAIYQNDQEELINDIRSLAAPYGASSTTTMIPRPSVVC